MGYVVVSDHINADSAILFQNEQAALAWLKRKGINPRHVTGRHLMPADQVHWIDDAPTD